MGIAPDACPQHHPEENTFGRTFAHRPPGRRSAGSYPPPQPALLCRCLPADLRPRIRRPDATTRGNRAGVPRVGDARRPDAEGRGRAPWGGRPSPTRSQCSRSRTPTEAEVRAWDERVRPGPWNLDLEPEV